MFVFAVQKIVLVSVLCGLQMIKDVVDYCRGCGIKTKWVFFHDVN